MRAKHQRGHVRCLSCGYTLYGLPGPTLRCPECGCEQTMDELLEARLSAPVDRIPWFASAATGVAVWLVILVFPRHALTTVLLLPAACVVLGFAFPERPWRWSTTLVVVGMLFLVGRGLISDGRTAAYVLVSLATSVAIVLLAPFALLGSGLRTLVLG